MILISVHAFPTGLTIAEYREERDVKIKKGKRKGKTKKIKTGFLFLTDLPISSKNVAAFLNLMI